MELANDQAEAVAALLSALKRLMAAERAASRATVEASVATRFESSDRPAAWAAEDAAGRELSGAWEAARAAIAQAETAQ